MTTPRIPTGRAYTPEAKRAVVERFLAAWLRTPDLRFGQLLSNAGPTRPIGREGWVCVDLFNVEDEPLIAMVERFAEPGEIPPMATNTLATGASEKPLTFTEIEAATLDVKPGSEAIAAIERGAFVAIAQAAARARSTWDAVAEKILADVEPEKWLLAMAVIGAARQRGELEPGLVLLAGPPASPVESTAISSPTTEDAAR